MQQTLVNLHAKPQAPPPPRDRLGNFQCTMPPAFSYVVEPMDADDWLKSVEKKLQVVQCHNREKVLLASHQLSGPAADWFTQLSRYAPHEVDTDEKKHECFLNDLNDGLVYALEARDFENFQEMVNKTLVLENHRGVIERNRKLVCQHQLSSSSKPRVATSSPGPVFRPAQPQFQPRP
jgi:hypothetical protein